MPRLAGALSSKANSEACGVFVCGGKDQIRILIWQLLNATIHHGTHQFEQPCGEGRHRVQMPSRPTSSFALELLACSCYRGGLTRLDASKSCSQDIRVDLDLIYHKVRLQTRAHVPRLGDREYSWSWARVFHVESVLLSVYSWRPRNSSMLGRLKRACRHQQISQRHWRHVHVYG